MMENRIPQKSPVTSQPQKRNEQYLARLKALEAKFDEFVRNEQKYRKEFELHFAQILEEQRKEIVRLHKELLRERQEKRIRNVRALTKFKSE